MSCGVVINIYGRGRLDFNHLVYYSSGVTTNISKAVVFASVMVASI